MLPSHTLAPQLTDASSLRPLLPLAHLYIAILRTRLFFYAHKALYTASSGPLLLPPSRLAAERRRFSFQVLPMSLQESTLTTRWLMADRTNPKHNTRVPELHTQKLAAQKNDHAHESSLPRCVQGSERLSLAGITSVITVDDILKRHGSCACIHERPAVGLQTGLLYTSLLEVSTTSGSPEQSAHCTVLSGLVNSIVYVT